MRIAVLADIHGNLPALRAVLAELDAEPVDAIVAAGDQVAGPCALATLEVSLDGVCFCHGSPRRDDEIITRATPDGVIAEILAATAAPLVVGGHTHQQMVRPLGDGHTYANAGSVGLPFEGAPGAFWMTVTDGIPAPRVTAYALGAARAELAATGFPALDDFLEGSPFDPLDPDWVTALFEHGSGRGEPPGDPRRPPA